ncbi:MAG TPA: glutamate-5-semialdehyde dehydrogenase [Bacteroidota bacterium]|nr:glutamate-5-semialdehyde dehydrogenase [Bacteroidota bacterium]
MNDPVVSKASAVKAASAVLYNCTTSRKNRLLRAIRERLGSEASSVLRENEADRVHAADLGLSSVLMDRLTLNEKRIRQMMDGIRDIIALPDPIGTVLERQRRPNGLRIEKVRVPLGAVGIIYESRPNVTIDASSLCLKSGNAVLLRGGSEAIRTNRSLVRIIKLALEDVDLPPGCVEFIDSTERSAVLTMVKQGNFLDVIIPRGSQQLIQLVQENSTVPVIAHGEGNCHVFVDSPADIAKAVEIVYNAKVQRPSVCNAAEKLLVHEKIAGKFLPQIAERLSHAGVLIKGDERTRTIITNASPVSDVDWRTEYLDLVIAVRVVSSLDGAIAHINKFGSHHSDAIVTAAKAHGERFVREVDSAAVYINASTRFTDGFEFGLGAEIGISTQKLHARGPMGLSELTSTKFIVRGSGQIRE